MSFGHGICMPVDEWMPRISCDFPAEIDPQALRNDKKVGVNKCVTAEDEMWGVDAGGRDVRRDECIARLVAAGSSGQGGPTFEHTQGGEGRSDPDIAPRGKKTRNISHRLRFYRLPV